MLTLAKQAKTSKHKIVNSMFNDDSFGENFYDERLSGSLELPAQKVFHDIFYAFFSPTVMLQERINEMLDHEGLEYGNYAVAHVDCPIVPKTDEEKKTVVEKVEKAMDCMTNLKPGGPYVVFAETFEAAGMATAYALEHGINVPSKQVSHDKHVIPKDLMGAWAEIYLMAGARCVSYGKGGFGQLGYMLGKDYDCRLKYAGERAQKCKWKDALAEGEEPFSVPQLDNEEPGEPDVDISMAEVRKELKAFTPEEAPKDDNSSEEKEDEVLVFQPEGYKAPPAMKQEGEEDYTEEEMKAAKAQIATEESAAKADVAEAEEAKPAAVEEAKPAVVEEVKPAAVEDAKPAVVEEVKPLVAEEAKPAAAEEAKPAVVEEAKPLVVEEAAKTE